MEDRQKEKEKARLRRRSYDRVREKTKRFFKWSRYWNYLPKEDIEEELWFRVNLFADNLSKCSCSMCCNTRRNKFESPKYRLTFQERRFFDSMEDQLKDL